jgi:hypothetical protein
MYDLIWTKICQNVFYDADETLLFNTVSIFFIPSGKQYRDVVCLVASNFILSLSFFSSSNQYALILW